MILKKGDLVRVTAPGPYFTQVGVLCEDPQDTRFSTLWVKFSNEIEMTVHVSRLTPLSPLERLAKCAD